MVFKNAKEFFSRLVDPNPYWAVSEQSDDIDAVTIRRFDVNVDVNVFFDVNEDVNVFEEITDVPTADVMQAWYATQNEADPPTSEKGKRVYEAMLKMDKMLAINIVSIAGEVSDRHNDLRNQTGVIEKQDFSGVISVECHEIYDGQKRIEP